MLLTTYCGHGCSPGPRKFKTAYKQAVSLEQRTIVGLNALLKDLSSWIAVMDDPPGDVPSNEITPQQLRELSYAWEKARASIRAALANLTNETAQ